MGHQLTIITQRPHKQFAGAEYVLRLLPRGTHDWRYFVKPEEMQAMLSAQHFVVEQTAGLGFNPFTRRWRVTTSMPVNYLLSAKRA
ncbi:MAG: hypothetical protein M1473_08480 [Firmicutes bacterium]|nr:hypothetical protein [Bacillota bacterium]